MSAADIAQLVGILSVTAMAVIFAVIAREEKRITRYGQEALVAASAFFVATALIRSVFLFGFVGRDVSQEMNGIVGIVFLVIGVEMLTLQRTETRSTNTSRRRRIEHLERMASTTARHGRQ